MARFRTDEEMFPLIETYLRSGKTQKVFCAERQLPRSVFAYWLKRYRRANRPEETAGFVELTPHRPPADGVHMEIAYPTGIRVRLFWQLPAAYVRQLLDL